MLEIESEDNFGLFLIFINSYLLLVLVCDLIFFCNYQVKFQKYIIIYYFKN